MIDLSDGLSSDLTHLCEESGVGASLEMARIPFDADVARIAKEYALDPLRLALDGGEDFELLFTVRPRDLARLPRQVEDVPATYIGDITNQARRIILKDGARAWNLTPQGFQHFDAAR